MTTSVCLPCANVPRRQFQSLRREPASRLPSALLTLLLAGLMVGPARAEPEDWSLHGYASQRLTHSNHGNQFFGETSDRFSTDYSEVGAGFFWRPHNQWQLSGQAIYRRGGASEEGRIEPDYLYAAYAPLDSEHGKVAIKLGKIKVAYGLYNEMRDTPMTRPGILPPQSIYLDSLRQFNQSALGIHLETERTFGNDTLALRLSQIEPNFASENTFWAMLGDHQLFTGALRARSGEAMAAQIAFDQDGGSLRALLSHAQGTGHYRPGAGDNWTGGALDFAFSALSLQWNGQDVTLSGELSRNDIRARFSSAGFLPDTNKQDVGSSWYGQAQWRFTPGWEALLRYDVVYSDDNDKDGEFHAAATGKPAWTRFAKDLTLGVRYRPNRNWLLAGEWHEVHGSLWLPPADNLDAGPWTGSGTAPRWHMFLLQATYQF